MIPVVQELSRLTPILISVDTVKAEVARRSLQAGACVINDITALHGDAEMPGVICASGAGLVLMHMQGTPQTMQLNPNYENVVDDIGAFFAERLRFAADRGIDPNAIALDPGIGFGKTPEQSMTAIARLAELKCFGKPLLVGASRKRFIDTVLPSAPDQRLGGSIASHLLAVENGAAIVRAHDVAETVQALRVAAAIRGAQ